MVVIAVNDMSLPLSVLTLRTIKRKEEDLLVGYSLSQEVRSVVRRNLCLRHPDSGFPEVLLLALAPTLLWTMLSWSSFSTRYQAKCTVY